MASNRSTKLPKEKAYSGVDMSGVTMTLDEIMAPIRAGRKDLLPVDLLPVDLLPVDLLPVDLLPVLRSVLQRNSNLWKEQGDAARRSLGFCLVRLADNDELIREQILLRINQMGDAVNKRQQQANRHLSDAIRQLQVAQKLQA